MRSTYWKLKGSNVMASRWWLSTWPTHDLRCTIILFVCLSLFLYPHYINSHYPINCKENFREKIPEIHLRVRDYILTILYTFFLVFLYFYFSNFISFKRFLAETHISHILSVVGCFGAFGKGFFFSKITSNLKQFR